MTLMRKHTTIDLDLELVREAAITLGTTRTTETIHAALAEVVARRQRAALARMDLPDLTPESLEEMRSMRGAVSVARSAPPRTRPTSGSTPGARR